MRKINDKIIISASIVFAVFGLFAFYSNNSKLEILNKDTDASSLEGSSGDQGDSKVSSDTFFLSALTSLGKITIDGSLFDSKLFKSLVDNSVSINPTSSGRENPFAPIGKDANTKTDTSAPSSSVSTNQPSQITSTTVILSGLVGSSSTTNVYFKYGTTEEVKEISPVAQISTNGLFSKNVINLTPKTKYFFKACAKINNIESCGELVSFTTI